MVAFLQRPPTHLAIGDGDLQSSLLANSNAPLKCLSQRVKTYPCQSSSRGNLSSGSVHNGFVSTLSNIALNHLIDFKSRKKQVYEICYLCSNRALMNTSSTDGISVQMLWSRKDVSKIKIYLFIFVYYYRIVKT